MDRDQRCPCCGQRVTVKNLPEGLHLTRSQLRIFELVSKAGPNGLPSDILLDRLYAEHADGGPAWAAHSMYVIVHNLNSKLLDHKLIIRANRAGPGSPANYVLKQL
jgi:hypothetical protein